MHSSKTYKKLVVITSRFPFPLEKGDKLRAYHQIKYLSQFFEIHLISTSDVPIKEEYKQELAPYCKSIQVFQMSILQRISGLFLKFFQNKPFQVGYFHHFSTQRKISRFLKELKPDHIYCQLIRASEYVKNYHDCPKTIDYMDALSKGMERRANTGKYLKKRIFNSEYKRLLRYENSIFEYFEHHTIISEQDKQYIFHKNREHIAVIPNGIDSTFLDYDKEPEKNVDLVFIGNMSYAPNITAAQFIVNDLLPLLPKELKVRIAGASPTREILKLASPQVEVTGFVEDIKMAYKSSKIFIAPMFLGTGLQNKLLEAMALGVPCISTSLANNALGAEAGKEILIADNKEDFVQLIQQLLSDKNLSTIIGENGKEFIKKNYQWDSLTKQLVDIINQEA